MTSIKRSFRWFAILFSIFLFGALTIPFATRMSQANDRTMSLTPGETLTINCDTELDTDVQGNQVSLKCAPLPEEPAATGFNGVTSGQLVNGIVNVEALTEGENIQQVKFTLQGPKEVEHSEHHAPFFLFGDNNGDPKGWDTREYPDGEYKLIARAINEQGQGKSTIITVRVNNGTETAPAEPVTDAPVEVAAEESTVNNNGRIMTIPGLIEAEHYRKGGQNTGYLDKSRGNQGDSNYRNDDVDIRNCDSNGDGKKEERCVGWWEGDEWLAYQVDIQSSGKYVFRVRGAADHNNAKLQLRIDDERVGEVKLRDTGSASKFDTSTSDQIQLPEGRHTLRIKQASGHSFDIDAIRVERVGNGGSDPQPTQTPPRDDSRLVDLPGTFEVENYRNGGRDTGYYDKSRGNKGDSNYRNDDVDIRNCGGDESGRCVGWWEGDEWLAYNVDIQSSGKY
ncbi:MAG: carbohydrate-binding protein, partial [Chloroflexota bacterium]